MANEITIVIKSRDESAAGVDSATAHAAALEARMKALGDEYKVAAAQTDDFGKKLKGTGSFAEYLDTKILGLTQRTKDLQKELNRTGDIDVFRHLADAEAESLLLNEIRTHLPAAADDAGRRSGKNFMTRIIEAIGSGGTSMVQAISNIPIAGAIFKPIADAMGSMPPQVQAAIAAGIVTAIVSAAAFIGAALNGVLLAGIGLGGIATGIIGQLHDPAVKAAFVGLGHDLMYELQTATSSFAGPLRAAASILKATFADFFQPGRFAGLAKEVEPLASGIQAMFRNMEPGFDKALEAAAPLLMELSQQLVGLGHALSQMFASFADGEAGAKEGLRALFLTIDALLIIVGQLVDALSHVFQWGVAIGDTITGWLAKLGWFAGILGPLAGMWHNLFHEIRNGSDTAADGVTNFGKVVGDTAVNMDDLAAAVNKTVNTADTLAGAMAGKLFSATMAIDQATLHWHESLTQLGDTLKQNGTQIDRHTDSINLNTQKGQENESAILGAVQANMQAYQAWIAAGGSATDAAARYDTNTHALEKQMRQAGYTQKEIDGLIGKYAAIPDEVNTSIVIEGLTEAINNLSILLGEINHVQTNAATIARINSNMGHLATGGIVGAASGMVRGGLTWVGEQGPELVRLPFGSTVMSNPDSMRAAAQSGQSSSGGSGGYFRHELAVSGNADTLTGTFLMNLLRNGAFSIQSRYVVN